MRKGGRRKKKLDRGKRIAQSCPHGQVLRPERSYPGECGALHGVLHGGAGLWVSSRVGCGHSLSLELRSLMYSDTRLHWWGLGPRFRSLGACASSQERQEPQRSLVEAAPQREGSRGGLTRAHRCGACSRQPPSRAPYHCPTTVPSYFGPRGRPPTALQREGNRDPQPSLPQTILVLGSPVSPSLPPTSFSITAEHTLRPGSGKAPGLVP